MILSRSEQDRYDRQMRIHGWGTTGQRKLKASKVAVVGVGGLGCLSSLYLAAAGIGRLYLVDKEKIRVSDLNRQILYCESDLEKQKADTARKKLETLNPTTKVEAVLEEVTEGRVPAFMEHVDVVVDGLDNWRTRFIINEHCVRKGIPFVHAGVSQFYGQVTTVIPGKGPCLRCIFSKEPLEIEVVPVFGATPAAVASLQVMEVIKHVTGIGRPLVGRMLFIDGEEMSFESVKIERKRDCPVCAQGEK